MLSLVMVCVGMVSPVNPSLAQDVQQQLGGAVNAAPHEQIRALNGYWRYKLGALPQSTMEIRSYLDDTATPSDWLSDFENIILPTVSNIK